MDGVIAEDNSNPIQTQLSTILTELSDLKSEVNSSNIAVSNQVKKYKQNKTLNGDSKAIKYNFSLIANFWMR